MTELQERFLRKAAEQLPLDRIVEVHLFPPIRQGALETGIAIVAVEVLVPAIEASAVADAPHDGAPAGDESVAPMQEIDPTFEIGGGAPAEEESAPACDPTEDAAGPAPDESRPAARRDEENGSDVAEPEDELEADFAESPARPAPKRHTVYTARYRATLKGPERGRFEVEVHEEADAPLVTIDAVVRGVQHRAGEPTEPERLPGERVRAIAGMAPAAAGAS